MNAVLTLLAGALVATIAGWWAMRSVEGSARVAIVAVLGVTAAAFNVVVPIPSVEATTTIVLCTALMLGARTGTAAGIVAVIASSVTGGVGTWTIWQLAAVALVALAGASLGRIGARSNDWFGPARMAVLAVSGAGAAMVWDVVTTLGSLAAFAPPGQTLLGSLLVGAAFTLTHMVFSALFTAVAGPSLVHALGRARPRLDGGVVLAN